MELDTCWPVGKEKATSDRAAEWCIRHLQIVQEENWCCTATQINKDLSSGEHLPFIQHLSSSRVPKQSTHYPHSTRFLVPPECNHLCGRTHQFFSSAHFRTLMPRFSKALKHVLLYIWLSLGFNMTTTGNWFPHVGFRKHARARRGLCPPLLLAEMTQQYSVALSASFVDRRVPGSPVMGHIFPGH